MIYIIAGTDEQARNYIKTQGLVEKHNATVVSEYTDLIGAGKKIEFVLIGSWYTRDDILNIKLELSRTNSKQLNPLTLKAQLRD